ncbi:MAG: dihydrolipoyl dehydrogenase family protein [Gammaproteobacteria bacterium]
MPTTTENTRRQDLVVVGAGAAGLSAASIASRIGARVTLIEAHRMGGDCLYTGCIPSKALLRAASCAQRARESHRFGIHLGEITIDFRGVREHIRRAIASIEPEDSAERYRSLGVQVLHGEATLIDPHTIRLGQETVTTRSIVLATGARPIIPTIPGLESAHWVTSETVWELASCPERLLVLGGGAAGCELGQAFARLGSRVTLVESGSRILGREPEAVADQLAPVLRKEGINLKTRTRALRIEGENPHARLVVSQADGSLESIDFDVLLIAVGRAPQIPGFEQLNLVREPDGRIATNGFLATSQPGIYAAGDVTSDLQFTHVAGQQGTYAALNALFRPLLRLRWNKSPVPRVTYTSPEIASVTRPGLCPSDLSETITIPLREINRAVTDGEENGCALIGVDKRGRPGSATLIMPHAGEIIPELALAIQERLTLDRILALIHPYPTYAEINRRAAAHWREAHLSKSGRRLTRMTFSLLRRAGSS